MDQQLVLDETKTHSTRWNSRGMALLALAGAGSVTCAVATACLGRWFQQRIGGFTGDCLGATQQVCELVFYLTALSMLTHSA